MYDLDQICIKRDKGVYLYLPKMKNIKKDDHPKYAYHEPLQLASNNIRNLLKSLGKIREQIVDIYDKKSNDVHVMSTKEWRDKGGIKLYPGDQIKVRSDKDDTLYLVKMTKDGSNIYCSCPSWKYQTYNPMIRTCKHIKAVTGFKIDKERVIKNMGILYDKYKK